jgi:adenylate kinase family enzyme
MPAYYVQAKFALVGDDVMIEIVQERLNRPDVRNGFVLDRFPRTVAQAATLDRIIHGRSPLIVIYMAVPDADVVSGRLMAASPPIVSLRISRLRQSWSTTGV